MPLATHIATATHCQTMQVGPLPGRRQQQRQSRHNAPHTPVVDRESSIRDTKQQKGSLLKSSQVFCFDVEEARGKKSFPLVYELVRVGAAARSPLCASPPPPSKACSELRRSRDDEPPTMLEKSSDLSNRGVSFASTSASSIGTHIHRDSEVE